MVVGDMVAELRGLINVVKDMQSRWDNRDSHNPSLAPYDAILNNVKEIYEREKRKYSVILQGFGSGYVDEI